MKLRFGHPVIAWNIDETYAKKGKMVRYVHGKRQPYTILQDNGHVFSFRHAEIDPEGTPIIGDTAEFSNDGENYVYQGELIGTSIDTDTKTRLYGCYDGWYKHCRYPQQEEQTTAKTILAEINEKIKKLEELL
jgi:hypothetical protein